MLTCPNPSCKHHAVGKPRGRPVVCGAALAVLLLAVASRAVFAGDGEMNMRVARFWEVKYGLADESDVVTRRARAVFGEVFAAAGKPGVPGRRADRVLVIVDAKQEMPLYALPDGHVVMGGRVARECFEGVPEPVGDARLAYILGHELAHLALRHALNDNILLGLTPDAAARSTLGLASKTENQNRELQADDRGVLYAMLAGYRITPLLAPLNGYASFWNWWDDRFDAQTSDTHPDSAVRVEVLKQRAASVRRSVAWYDAGVRLSLSGQYAAARLFLDAYAEAFPSHDAFNALGVLRLREAAAAGARLSRPAVVDADSQSSLVSISADAVPREEDAAAIALRDAADHFRAALDIAPDDLPAAVNLVTALQAMGRDWEAGMERARARRQAEDRDAIRALDTFFGTGEPPVTGDGNAVLSRDFIPAAFRARLDAVAERWRAGPPSADTEIPSGWLPLELPAAFGLDPMLATLRAKAFRTADDTALILFFEDAGKPAGRRVLAMVTQDPAADVSSKFFEKLPHVDRVLTTDGAFYSDAAGGVRVRGIRVTDAWRIWCVQAETCMP